MNREQLVTELDENTALYLAAYDNCRDFASVRPGEEEWSALLVMEHVVTVEMGSHKVLNFNKKPGDVDTWGANVGNEGFETILGIQAPKFKAPSSVEPKGRYTDFEEGRNYFTRERDSLRSDVLSGEIIFSDSLFSHPRFGLITNLDWLLFIVAHARRHTYQLERIAETLQEK